MDKNYKRFMKCLKIIMIMFLILSFNPSTVLESKYCELKQNALIEIIKNAETTSF